MRKGRHLILRFARVNAPDMQIDNFFMFERVLSGIICNLPPTVTDSRNKSPCFQLPGTLYAIFSLLSTQYPVYSRAFLRPYN